MMTMMTMNLLHKQRGSTLLVALIMLVLLTLIAVSAINSTTSSIQVVGNAQFQQEANAAAQKAIEIVLSNSNFSDPATPPLPQNINNYIVTFTPRPSCTQYVKVTPGTPNVPIICASSEGATCYWATWEITAVVNDANTGASLIVHQGIKTISGLNAALASC